jgi:hypothetical protein
MSEKRLSSIIGMVELSWTSVERHQEKSQERNMIISKFSARFNTECEVLFESCLGYRLVSDTSVIEGLLQLSIVDQCGKGNQINKTRAEQINDDFNVLHHLNKSQSNLTMEHNLTA